MTTLMQDLRYGLRMLAKNPGFTAVAVITLALGIGANTAIFSLIEATLFRSLPVHAPQELVVLEWTAHTFPHGHEYSSYGYCFSQDAAGTSSGCSFPQPFFNELHSRADLYSGVTAFAGAGQLDMTGNGPARMLYGEFVSGDYFETLGVRAAVGRTLERSDDMPSAPPVIVLNYAYWQAVYGGALSAIGKTTNLNGVPFTIAGVAEARFTGLAAGSTEDVWLPLSTAPHLGKKWKDWQADPGAWWLTVVARLKPGKPAERAQAATNLLFGNEMLHGAKPMFQAAEEPAIKLWPARQTVVGSRRKEANSLYLLMVGVGIVLLIACANVGGLTLARATGRQKEVAVRLAVGGSRRRILRQFLTESVVLSTLGGTLGILIASWGASTVLAVLSSSVPRPLGLTARIDLRVLVFTLTVSVVTGILFGIVPALRSLRVDLTPALKEGAGSSVVAVRGRIGWFTPGNALVVAQVALAIVLLVGAGLFVRTLANLKSIDPGFDTRNILLFGIDPTLAGYKGAQLGNLYRDLQNQFAGLQGVTSASYSWFPLLSGSTSVHTMDFHPPGSSRESRLRTDWLPVGTDFFKTMRIPMLAGRVFTASDIAEVTASEASSTPSTEPTPVVVNEKFVRRYFNNVNPLGQRFGESKGKNPGFQIIGVVRDVKYSDLRDEIHPMTYAPLTGSGAYFELRTAGNPVAMIPAVHSVVSHLDTNLPLVDVKTESQQIDEKLSRERVIARLSGCFGLLALVLACVGLYGLLSHEVVRRTREIGVRMAMGARSDDVVRLVVEHGVALALVGTAVGVAASFGVMRFLASFLYSVHPADPVTFIAVGMLLLLVTLVACYLPARRATKVDPMVALRYE